MDSKQHHVEQHRALTILLRHLQALIAHSSVSKSGLMHALYSEDVTCLANNIVTAPVVMSAILPPGSGLHRELELSLITFLLSTALTYKEHADSEDGKRLTLRLLQRQRQLATTPTFSDHQLQRKCKTTSIFERPCTQDERGVSVQWKEKLAAQLDMDTMHRQEAVVRFVGQLCRDLEERCDDIEEPLRQERTNHEQTREKCKNHEDRIVNLEDQLDSKNDIVADLRRAKDAIENDFEAAQIEADSIKEKACDLANQLKRAREDLKRELGEASRRHESAKLEMQASLACRTEQMDDQEDEIKSLRVQMQDFKKVRTDESTGWEQQRTALEQKLEAAYAHGEAEAIRATRTNEELAQSKVRIEELTVMLESAQTQARESDSALQQAKTDFVELEQSTRQKEKAKDEEHQCRLVELDEHLLSVRQDMEHDLRSFEVELERLKAGYETKLASKDAKLQESRRRVQHLAAQSQQKSRELEEAQKMRAGLMSALGLNAAHMPPPQKKTASARVASAPSSVGAEELNMDIPDEPDREEEEDISILPSGSEDEADADVQPTSSPAFEPPVPAKPKLRAAFKQPTMRRKSHNNTGGGGVGHEPAARERTMSTTAGTARKRQALRQSVPNIPSPLKRAGLLKPSGGWAEHLGNVEPDWEAEKRAGQHHSPMKTPGRRQRRGLKDAEVGNGKENLVPVTPRVPVGTYGTDLGLDDFDATTVEF